MSLRRASVVLFALLAAAPLLAQKPVADDLTDPQRARYHDRLVAACVANLNDAEGVSAEASESVCGCASIRSMARWPTGALPPIEEGRLPFTMGGDLVACAGGENSSLAAAVARRVAETAVVSTPPVVSVTPDKPRAPPEPDTAPSPGFDPGAWFEGLSLPRWVTDSGLPIWVLGPLALFVFLFFRGLFRRSEGNDLMGPPPGMQPGTRPPPPRRP